MTQSYHSCLCRIKEASGISCTGRAGLRTGRLAVAVVTTSVRGGAGPEIR